MKTIRVILMFTLLFNIACKDDNDGVLPSDDLDQEGIISGNILLPAASTINVNSLTVISPYGDSMVTNDSYKINAPSDTFGSQMVLNANNEMILMGFTYPGQSNFDINAETTALALLMNAPASLFVGKEGKKQLITSYRSNQYFGTLIIAIEDALRNEESPLSNTSYSIIERVAQITNDVFPNPRTSTSRSDDEINSTSRKPLEVFKTGREVTFINPGNSYETVIGVYFEDSLVTTMVIPRVSFFPTGIGDVIGALASANAGVIPSGLATIEETYMMTGEGTYQFKIRNGYYTNGIDSENIQAYISNLINWNTDILLEIVPLRQQCVQSVLADLREFIQSAATLIQNDTLGSGEILGLIYNFLSEFLSQSPLTSNCFPDNFRGDRFIQGLRQVLGFTALVGRLGHAGNTLFGIGQWIVDNGSIDLLYEVTEDDVTCGNENGSNAERQILTNLFNANPQNTLGWNLCAPNIDGWQGVGFNDTGRVLTLDISSANLSVLPSDISGLTELIELDARDNNLVTIPSSIGALTNLQELQLDDNNLSSIPGSIGQLILLTDLDFENNNLTSIPPEISQLTNLFDVDFGFNNITSIPMSVNQLPNLEFIDLESNNIGSISPSLANTPVLKWLNVKDNNLSCIPDEVCNAVATIIKNDNVECGCN